MLIRNEDAASMMRLRTPRCLPAKGKVVSLSSGARQVPAGTRKLRETRRFFSTDLGALQQWRTFQASHQMSCSACSTKSTLSSRYEQIWATQQRSISQQTIYSACRRKSAPSSKTWTVWHASAVERPRWTSSQPVTASTSTGRWRPFPTFYRLQQFDQEPRPNHKYVALVGCKAPNTLVSITSSQKRVANAHTLLWPSQLLRQVRRCHGANRSLQDKTKATEVRKGAMASTSVTKTQ